MSYTSGPRGRPTSLGWTDADMDAAQAGDPSAKPGEMRVREHILREAEQAIMRDRHATYGEAEDSFAAIAGAWSWWLEGRLATPLTTYDVAEMMSLLKKARARGNHQHMDTHVDDIGYTALAAEIASASPRTEK